MVRAVALQFLQMANFLGPRFESCFGHNIIIPFLGDCIAVDCDIALTTLVAAREMDYKNP